MKTKKLQLRIVSTAGAVLALFAWGLVSAEVVNSPHNLGTTTGTGKVNTYSGTDEVCVFCHTPHGADNSQAVPLWNRTLNPSTAYTTYATLNSSTIQGAIAPTGSVSIACLSCHDGTQALDTVLNEPGSGLLGTPFAGGTWTGGAGSQLDTGTGQLSTGSAVNLTQDLSNDHPVGIQYGGGGLTVASPTGALNDPDFKATDNAVFNGTTIWWVDTETTPNGTREKTDMQLYTRTVATIDGGAFQPFVECASCHDPHSSNDLFLRVDNAGSAVCLACHTK